MFVTSIAIFLLSHLASFQIQASAQHLLSFSAANHAYTVQKSEQTSVRNIQQTPYMKFPARID
jgi:hypothetical protein